MRRLLPGLALAILAAASAATAETPTILVEDWSRQPPGRTGVPQGWSGHSWGSPKYDLAVITDGAERILHLRSHGDNSTISREIKVDVKELPLLVWRWKVVTLPAGGDCRRKATDDEAAQIYVTFPRLPTSMRSRIIGYVWDTTAPAGTIVRSESSALVTYVVVRSGTAEVGRWLTETRNVYDDYTRIHGEAPTETVGAVSVAIDSNDTRTSAESYIGTILFRKP
jgi:Protein of unknown function (DUF3047)